MSTKTIETKLNNLNQQMIMLRSVVISVIGGKDPEGEYRPEFVSQTLKLMGQKQSGIKFTSPADFLKIIG
jgi:hypothetical protein